MTKLTDAALLLQRHGCIASYHQIRMAILNGHLRAERGPGNAWQFTEDQLQAAIAHFMPDKKANPKRAA